MVADKGVGRKVSRGDNGKKDRKIALKPLSRAVASPGPGQGCSQPNTARGPKKIQVGAKYLSSFLKFEMKNRHKIAEEAKTYYLLFVTSVLFFKVIK